MRVLIACEYSGVVREAFARQGHIAISCDLHRSLQPCGPGAVHYRCDVRDVLHLSWDLVIAHPPCTDLTVAGNRHLAEKLKDGRSRRGFEFFMTFFGDRTKHVPGVAAENPVGLVSRWWRKPDQYVHPFWFGHPETKKTGLWLKGLPPLVPTLLVEPAYAKTPAGEDARCGHNGGRCSAKHWNPNAWAREHLAGMIPNCDMSVFDGLSYDEKRGLIRSITTPGMAEAMALQWGKP